MKTPVRLAVTGAAGQIGYQLLFRIASGQMLGDDQPVILQMLEIPAAMGSLIGVVMELEDCAYPLVAGIEATDDPYEAFEGVSVAMLVGAMPRKAGMARSDLLEANAGIFNVHGRALNKVADRNVKVVVVGNPANTNALITSRSAPDIDPSHITAMTRLDQNRAMSALATRLGVSVASVKRLVVWGNHSGTQFPDLFHCLVDGKPATDLVDSSWYVDSFIPRISGRGGAVISARGSSSAASAAKAAMDHMRDWIIGTPKRDWVSMAVRSDGSYGVPEGLISSFPCTTKGGEWSIVRGLEINEFARERIDASVAELVSERETLDALGVSSG